jgi:hypothetical protein
MGKRTLMALGLGLVVMMGVAALGAPINIASANPAGRHASGTSGGQAAPSMSHPSNIPATASPTEATEQSGDQAGDSDANAPCSKDAQGNETGNCENSQNSSGSGDNGQNGG